MIDVYDFLNLATDDFQEIRIYDMNPAAEREVFCGEARSAMYHDEYSGCEVLSFDIDEQGITLNIDTSEE